MLRDIQCHDSSWWDVVCLPRYTSVDSSEQPGEEVDTSVYARMTCSTERPYFSYRPRLRKRFRAGERSFLLGATLQGARSTDSLDAERTNGTNTKQTARLSNFTFNLVDFAFNLVNSNQIW
eukprot:1060513-Pyramimonas_sp.AAC.1